MEYGLFLLLVIFAYLLGSIPTGFLLIKKIMGIDIRTCGSGNIGSTNVRRVGGRKISLATQVVDILKGFISVLIAYYLILHGVLGNTINKDIILCSIGVSAILGHNYSIYLGFKGGKGVNTTVGVFIFIATKAMLLGCIVYLLLGLKIKIVSIRSMILGLVLFVSSIIFGYSKIIIITTLISEIILVYRHKENIKRIIRGEEK